MTYSIVAVDTATREVGGSGTSCIGNVSVRVIYGSVPDVGVVHAQALLGGPGKDAAVAQLGMGVPPDAIVAAITLPSFDGNAQRRQYGIVDLEGRAAGFTGAQTGAIAEDLQAELGTFTWSVQGNILNSDQLVDAASFSFRTMGCDLADRLMLALEAGANNGRGDSRCTPQGIPGDSAFIEVDRPGEPAGSYLRLEVTGTGSESAVAALRVEYDAWRATHPCPVVPVPEGVVGDGSTPGDAGGCCSSSGDGGSLACAVLVGVLLARSRRR